MINRTKLINGTYLEIHGGINPNEGPDETVGGLLAGNTRNPDDPPLRAEQSEVVEVELLGPGGVALLGFDEELLLDVFFPVVGAHPALPPLVPQLPPLPRCQLTASTLGAGGGGAESRRQWWPLGSGGNGEEEYWRREEACWVQRRGRQKP